MKRFILLTFLAFTIAGSALAAVVNLSPYIDAGSAHTSTLRSTSVAIPNNISYSDTVRCLGAQFLQLVITLTSPTDTEGGAVFLQGSNDLTTWVSLSTDSTVVTVKQGLTYPYAAGFQYYRLYVNCLGDTLVGNAKFRFGGKF